MEGLGVFQIASESNCDACGDADCGFWITVSCQLSTVDDSLPLCGLKPASADTLQCISAAVHRKWPKDL